MVNNQQRNKASSSTASVAAAQKAKKKVGFRAGKGGPENPKCQYRGVRQRTWGKWVAELRIPGGQREWLGSYATAEAAAKAYDEATIKYRGLSGATKLNFPENYPITRSRSCKDSTSTDHHKSEKKDSNSKDQDLACSSLTSQSSRKKDSNSSSSNAAAASGGCTEPVLLFGANIAAGGVEETSPHLISNRPLNKLEASR